MPMNDWDERDAVITEFIWVMREKRVLVNSFDRTLLECFWTFLLAKQLGMKEGEV